MSDTAIRVSIFAGVFAVFAALELIAPKRDAALSRKARWPGAAVLLISGAAIGRLVLPVGLAGIALWAQARGYGVFNALNFQGWTAFIAALILLDLAVWLQHVAMHRVPWLWRMHRVHHSDPHIDVTTALRFHPAEILTSLAWKGAIVAAFGIPPAAAFWFEVVLNALAQFNHANIHLPKRLDAALRVAIVTPDMHRVHHSIDGAEHNRNFGFCLSVWDRLFGLYKSQPDAGHAAMVIGLDAYRTGEDQSADQLLLQPIRPTA